MIAWIAKKKLLDVKNYDPKCQTAESPSVSRFIWCLLIMKKVLERLESYPAGRIVLAVTQTGLFNKKRSVLQF